MHRNLNHYSQGDCDVTFHSDDCYRDAHGRSVRAVLQWADRRSGLLKLGILGTLAAFLAWSLAVGLGWLGRHGFDDAVAFFRLGIAFSVLPLAWLAPGIAPAEPAEVVRSPFPVHLSALIGLRVVLWLFRLIGLLWLIQGSLHVAERMGLARQPTLAVFGC